ncbi:divergent polysaccharide deacetylase family protein [Rhodobacteraceae bacterium 63075]|nr:divergent polysaccharide deacetylase family protein [Rhodobacteraceae bacterium 63075]
MIGGVAVAGVGLGALSLSTEIPGAKPPEASADISTPQDSPPEGTAPSRDAQEQGGEDAGIMVEAPQTEAPEAEASSGVGGVDTTSSGKPEVETGGVAPLAAPEDSESSAMESGEDGTAQGDTPDLSAEPAGVPDVPESEAEVNVETQSADPRPEPEDPAQPAAPETEQNAPSPDSQEDADGLPAPLPDEEREEITLVLPDAGEAGEDGDESERVSIGTPASTLESSQSNRLPSLGNSDQEATEPTTEESAAELPPVARYAAPFEPQSDAPKMAIVLIDDGTSDIGVEALSTFPYPLSFAVDTSWEGAGEAMQMYRAKGFEVLAMVDLPEGATATDVEVSMPVLLGKVPEAVGVMETPDAGLQDSREVAAQVAEYTRDSGHGLLFFPKGLNTAQKLAAKEGVPSASVFRDFDGEGQNASAVKRFLNHGALKAGSEGGVVMVGRLRADTISALLLWGLQERGSRVELAPISQLMQASDTEG